MKRLPLLLALFSGLALWSASCTTPDPYADVEPVADTAADTQPAGANAAPPADSSLAPDFALPTLAGDTLRLSDLRGQIVLINFWATWCAPCVAEIPEFVALHQELHPHGLSVIGISVDQDNPDVVRTFAEGLYVNYPILLDADQDVIASYGGVWALPTTFVIDPDGRIMQRTVGLFPVEDMRPRFREVLGLSPNPSP